MLNCQRFSKLAYPRRQILQCKRGGLLKLGMQVSRVSELMHDGQEDKHTNACKDESHQAPANPVCLQAQSRARRRTSWWATRRPTLACARWQRRRRARRWTRPRALRSCIPRLSRSAKRALHRLEGPAVSASQHDALRCAGSCNASRWVATALPGHLSCSCGTKRVAGMRHKRVPRARPAAAWPHA